VEGDLIQAMLTNPHLKIEVENGLYDLATPFYATEYTMEHLGLPDKLQKNIHLQYYDAGHMMYLREEDLAKLKSNIGSFIEALPSSNRTNHWAGAKIISLWPRPPRFSRSRLYFFWTHLPFGTVILKKWHSKPSLAVRMASRTIEELQKSDLLPHSRLASASRASQGYKPIYGNYDAYYASAEHSFAGAGAFFGARRAAHHSHRAAGHRDAEVQPARQRPDFFAGPRSAIEVSGQLVELKYKGLECLTPQDTSYIANDIMGKNETPVRKLEQDGSADLSYG